MTETPTLNAMLVFDRLDGFARRARVVAAAVAGVRGTGDAKDLAAIHADAIDLVDEIETFSEQLQNGWATSPEPEKPDKE